MFIAVFVLIGCVSCNSNLEFRGGSRKETSHQMIIKEYFKHRMTWTTSTLGAVLYKNIDEKLLKRKNRNFVILVWKWWNALNSRLAINHETKSYDPLRNCPIRNCDFTGDNTRLDSVDAVIIFMFKGEIPQVTHRNLHQRWIFLSEESPVNTFSGAMRKPRITNLANIFNWSMTYRSDSDIPIPYGRTIALPRPVYPPEKTNFDTIASLVPYWEDKKRDVLVTVLMSHCVKHRMKYIKYLRKLIKIDFFGKCSGTYRTRKKCPGHFNSDCGVISKYLFYLVLENTSCRQYMTEKLFYNAYLKGAIPIIRNPMLRDCERLLPPNSFLHVENYGSPSLLVDAIKSIGADDKKILSYHVWRNHFNVTNEHGFFGSESLHYCRVCQAMNYNSEEVKTYDEDEMRLFLDQKILCETIGAMTFVNYRRKMFRRNTNTTLASGYRNISGILPNF